MSTKKQAEAKAAKEGKVLAISQPTKEKKNTAGHYVKNADLRAELIRCREKDELTTEAVVMFQLIATRLSSKLKYNNPDDRQDCISSAVLDCIRYWRNFNPEVSDNAFAYITTVCRNGFAKGWRQLGKIQCPDSLCVPISDNLYSL